MGRHNLVTLLECLRRQRTEFYPQLCSVHSAPSPYHISRQITANKIKMSPVFPLFHVLVVELLVFFPLIKRKKVKQEQMSAFLHKFSGRGNI